MDAETTATPESRKRDRLVIMLTRQYSLSYDQAARLVDDGKVKE